MSPSRASRTIAAAVLVSVAVGVVVYGCRDQPTEPTGFQGSAAARGKQRLTVTANGSTANGMLLSSRGGISCTVTVTGTTVSMSGKCSKDLNKGMVLLVLAQPPANGGTVAWTGCDQAVTDDPLSCKVTMSSDRVIGAKFAPPPNSYALIVQGGSDGSGTVRSTPSGISCTISSGSSSTGCSSFYSTSTSVTLDATAASGSYVKAWAGGGCENSGTGIGAGSGRCVVPMNQAHIVVVSFETLSSDAAGGTWAAPIDWPHVAIHAHLLPNGKVMTYGRMMTTGTPVLWTPETGVFTNLPRPADLFCSGHAFLPDGRLIVTGGHSGADIYGIKTTYLYDFELNQWTRGADMQNGRWYPTTTTLANGEILTISGGDTAAATNTIPEVWQGNETWRALTGANRWVAFYPMMFVAPDGRVVMVGPGQQGLYLNTSGTGAWTTGPRSNFGDRDYGSAVMYDGGKILLVGGNQTTPTRKAEVIDLNPGAAATWRYVDSMSVGRRQLNATLLADGKVLVTGGSNASGFNSPPTDSRVLAAEVWDPATERWSQWSRMTHQRLYHATAMLLLDGRILSVGSGEPAASGQINDYTAEIFSPPYLFNADGSPAARPTISDAPISVSYGQTFTVGTPEAGSIAKVTWIRLSSVTHAFNQNQRMNLLAFSATSSSALSIVAPASGNHAPPGHYMLFLINASGVPSQGKIIRIF